MIKRVLKVLLYFLPKYPLLVNVQLGHETTLSALRGYQQLNATTLCKYIDPLIKIWYNIFQHFKLKDISQDIRTFITLFNCVLLYVESIKKWTYAGKTKANFVTIVGDHHVKIQILIRQ